MSQARQLHGFLNGLRYNFLFCILRLKACCQLLPYTQNLCNSTTPLSYTCSANATFSNASIASTVSVFQDGTYNPLSPGVTTDVAAIDPNGTVTAPSASYSCPTPTVVPTDQSLSNPTRINGGACAAPCPPLLYTTDQYSSSDRLMIGLSVTGLILTSIHLITLIIFKKARRKPYPLFFTVNTWAISLVLFFTVAVKNSDNPFGVFAGMQCIDNSRGQFMGYCLFQAIVVTFCGFSATCWWCIQAVDLLLHVAFNASKWSPQRKLKLLIAYYIWGWAWPLIMVIAVAGKFALYTFTDWLGCSC